MFKLTLGVAGFNLRSTVGGYLFGGVAKVWNSCPLTTFGIETALDSLIAFCLPPGFSLRFTTGASPFKKNRLKNHSIRQRFKSYLIKKIISKDISFNFSWCSISIKIVFRMW